MHSPEAVIHSPVLLCRKAEVSKADHEQRHRYYGTL